MKLLRFLSTTICAVMLFASCDDSETTTTAIGTMAAEIDGKSVIFESMAVKVSEIADGTNASFESLGVTGVSGMSQSTMKSIVLTANATKIKSGTYTFPVIDGTSDVDYGKGFAVGVYVLGGDENGYTSIGNGASGGLTINSISENNVTGSFDMVLVNPELTPKTIKLKGSFNAILVNHSDME